MAKSEREETISSLSSVILSSILDELVLDAALSAHHEISRAGAVCPVCKTKCSAVHIPPSLSNMNASSSQLASRPGTPSSGGEKGNGANTPNGKGEGEGKMHHLQCIQCAKKMASNVYARHLSACMGLPNSRRGPPRTSSKAGPPSDAGRSASPGSDMGYGSEDRSPSKGKGRDEDSYTLKRKRGTSPHISPTKKAKGRPLGSPISRVKADGDGSGVASNQSIYSPSTLSHSRIPSKLRDSSTAPYNRHSPGSSASLDSSPEGAPTPSATSSFTQSPSLSNRVPPGGSGGQASGGARGRGRPLGSGTGPPKRSPPLQMQVQRPAPPVLHSHFGMDVDEGEETGSSTDTSDSS